ncbi:hypothetical protein E2C01_075083 [Portunus trituberculatus]|uniref:Uncharacterized protein n=1 Tax=Portunus trituberculatus TaxID=210409 RepID=A0A5B7IE12_PORTR|nr:hypothetical protein [Portunus trituberculatus]
MVVQALSSGSWSWRRRVVRQPRTPATKGHTDSECPSASRGQKPKGRGLAKGKKKKKRKD